MPSALITGSSKGIGYETALAFARAGYRVHATMRNPSSSPALSEMAAQEKLPVGVTANLAYTGKTTAPYANGVVNYGEYATVNLSGRWFLDAARHHQLNLAVQNLFDRAYGRFYRGCADVLRDFPLGCSKPYPYQGLALPRTVQVSYRYAF